MPRTVAGLAVWLLLVVALVGSSGALLFAFEQSRIAAGEQARLAKGRQVDRQQAEGAKGGAPGEAQRSPIRSPEPKDEAARVIDLVGPSIASIEDVDPGGNIIRGSGFVLQSSARDTWVLTNHHLVASAASGNRGVRVRLGNLRLEGTVRSEDPERDLAVIVVSHGGVPALNRIGNHPVVGDPVWGAAAAGLPAAAPAQPALVGQGRVAEAPTEGLLIEGEALVGTGGPLLDREGKVVGVLSVRYAPAGYPPSGRWAIPIQVVCLRLLECSRPSPTPRAPASPAATDNAAAEPPPTPGPSEPADNPASEAPPASVPPQGRGEPGRG